MVLIFKKVYKNTNNMLLDFLELFATLRSLIIEVFVLTAMSSDILLYNFV